MDINTVASILDGYRDGQLSKGAALDKLKQLPYEDLEYVKIDHHRMLRQGFPEVVFAQGKTPAQVAAIVERLAECNHNVLASRATPEMYAAVRARVPAAEYAEVARMILVRQEEVAVDQDRVILIMTAGTSDIPVAEEAAVTAEVMGNKVKRVFDVGVAGIHRLLAQRQLIEEANVIIVVAGMEGALASVVGGMASKPVIAVPTSVGYGANFGGIAALLAMLNSCAAGVAVVNIDNGFGAGRLASIINKMR